MVMSTVCVVRGNYLNINEKIRKAVEIIGSLNISDYERVVIKINLCDARTPETGAITHPLFLDGVLKYLKENYGNLNVYVVESDSTVVIADYFVNWFGFKKIIEKWGARWINLSKQPTIKKQIDGKFFREISVPEIFEDSYFITLAKLKTNMLTKITCCLKNQFGCLPIVEKSIYHSNLDDVIADVNLAIKPDFCIVDGIISMGGAKGPAYGIPIPAGIIVCGKDPVAVDTVCSKIIGFNPFLVGHIRKAASLGVGSMSYVLRNEENINTKINFEVDKLEMRLFKMASSLQRKATQQLRKAWKKERRSTNN